MSRRYGKMIGVRHGAVSRQSCLRRMHSTPGLMVGKNTQIPKPPKPQLPKPPKPRDTALLAGQRLRLALDKHHGEAGPKPFKLADDTPEARKAYARVMLGAGYRVSLVPREQMEDELY
jgi:hypothetical protein